MALRKEYEVITEHAYLQGERVSDIKHEYIDGQVYAMGGASNEHNRLTSTIGRKLGNQLHGQPCDVYQSDFQVKIGTKYFYPDVVVKCDNDNPYYTEKPIVIVEVLSPSTRSYDETVKLRAYLTIPSLQEYGLVYQDMARVEVFRRVGELWTAQIYHLGDDVQFESIHLSVSIEEIYERVNNADMRQFLAAKQDG